MNKFTCNFFNDHFQNVYKSWINTVFETVHFSSNRYWAHQLCDMTCLEISFSGRQIIWDMAIMR